MRYYNLSIRGRIGDFTLACSLHVYGFKHYTVSIAVSINLSLLFVIKRYRSISLTGGPTEPADSLQSFVITCREKEKERYIFSFDFVLKIYNK